MAKGNAASLESAISSLDSARPLESKTIKKIFEVTPIYQAIMLVGIHGIGKSQFVEFFFIKQDYALIILFLGQMSDSGDVIGLPDRTIVTFKYGDKEVQQKITEFCPPKWFPRDDNAKIVIFLDEFNRGKPEVYQCIQDMVLNRSINGLKLPKYTRIIAAINPLDDKYGYQVTELDPALLDRFNIYGFAPSRKEWVYWAIDNKVHKLVIGFIIKQGALHLDPPANGKMGIVYPSRRSWVRLSDILIQSPSLLNEEEFITLRDVSVGIIGEAASAAFYAFLKEQKKGIHPGRIITSWDKETEKKVKSASNQELLVLNLEMATHLEEEEEQYFGKMESPQGKKQAEKYAYNIYQYLKSIPAELVGDFVDYLGESTVDMKKTWAKKLLDSYEPITNWFIDLIHGKTKQEKEDEENHFNDPDIEELLKE